MSTAICLSEFLIWAAAFPIMMGLLPFCLMRDSKPQFHKVIIVGYLLSFGVFELIGIPILMFTKMGNFTLLMDIYITVCLIIIAVVTGYLIKGKVSIKFPKFNKDRETIIFAIVYLSLLGLQIYMAVTHATYQNDDAYYLVQSLQTWNTKTMYHYEPYTGVTTSLDVRHALAMFPMWIAFLSTMSGIHPTILAHTLLPIVIFPMCDAAVLGVFNELMNKKKAAAGMVLLKMIEIFGNVSIFVPEAFLLIRSWQGKSMFINFILPCLLMSLLLVYKNSKTGYLILLLVNIACGMMTTMALFYVLVIEITSMILIHKNVRKTLACSIPLIANLGLFAYLVL